MIIIKTQLNYIKWFKNLTRSKIHNINVQIEAAAEYYVDYEFEQKIGKEKFVFGDKYILLSYHSLKLQKVYMNYF